MVTQSSAPFRLDSSGNSGVIYQGEMRLLDSYIIILEP